MQPQLTNESLPSSLQEYNSWGEGQSLLQTTIQGECAARVLCCRGSPHIDLQTECIALDVVAEYDIPFMAGTTDHRCVKGSRRIEGCKDQLILPVPLPAEDLPFVSVGNSMQSRQSFPENFVSTPSWGVVVPWRDTTLPIVINRIRRSSQSDLLSAYQTSKSNFSGHEMLVRPLTCAHPVIPGRTSCRRA